jgi:hypothetical protein
MKLSFHGAHYEHRSTEQEFTEGEVGGKYRGALWKLHQYLQPSRRRPYSQEMTYRGVHYRKG